MEMPNILENSDKSADLSNFQNVRQENMKIESRETGSFSVKGECNIWELTKLYRD